MNHCDFIIVCDLSLYPIIVQLQLLCEYVTHVTAVT
jgi:hypothetical protein